MEQLDLSNARILIVDDEAANIGLLTHILEPVGYRNIVSTTEPRRVTEICAQSTPDIVLLDLLMPHMDGFQVMEEIQREIPDAATLPIVILTSDESRESKQRALSAGARDYLTKPLSPSEVRLRVANLLTNRFLHLALQENNVRLEDKVRERTEELEKTRIEILERLALAAEYRDDDTGEHTERVGRMSARLARVLELPTRQVQRIRRAAPLHDVGKIGIHDSILLKPGKLDPSEFEIMKTHATIGAEILSGSRFPLLKMAEESALWHHENWDGTGYPDGLQGSMIPLSARIVAVVDVFDSLTHDRVYKDAWSKEAALEEIRRQSGAKFDPDVVEAFLSLKSFPAAGTRPHILSSSRRMAPGRAKPPVFPILDRGGRDRSG